MDVVVPADKLSSMCESVDEIIEFQAAESAVHLVGSDSRLRFTVTTRAYPVVPGFEGKADFEVKLDKLQEGIEQTVFAAAKESTRYALNGILWEITGKKLGWWPRTDGGCPSRLFLWKKPAHLRSGIIVPAKTMTILDKIPVQDARSRAFGSSTIRLC